MRGVPAAAKKLSIPFLVVGALVLAIAFFPLAIIASVFLLRGQDRWNAGTIAGGLALCAAFWLTIWHLAVPSLHRTASPLPSAPTYGYSAEERRFLDSQGVSPAEARAVETAICRETAC